MNMEILVLDASVLKCFEGKFEAVISEYTLDEIMDNLKRRARTPPA